MPLLQSVLASLQVVLCPLEECGLQDRRVQQFLRQQHFGRQLRARRTFFGRCGKQQELLNVFPIGLGLERILECAET